MTSNNLAQIREKLEKGCGKDIGLIPKTKLGIWNCGDCKFHKNNIKYCLECEAKLKLRDEIEKMISKNIDIWVSNMFSFNKKIINTDEVKELKQSLGISEGVKE